MNHPNRRKPSREALELVAHFARHGIALDPEQQDALATICRVARGHCRIETEACNGPSWQPVWADSAERTRFWERWSTDLDRRRERTQARIKAEAAKLPHVAAVAFSGDPRGVTVKLVMVPEFRRLHDSFGGEGLCVPGS